MRQKGLSAASNSCSSGSAPGHIPPSGLRGGGQGGDSEAGAGLGVSAESRAANRPVGARGSPAARGGQKRGRGRGWRAREARGAAVRRSGGGRSPAPPRRVLPGSPATSCPRALRRLSAFRSFLVLRAQLWLSTSPWPPATWSASTWTTLCVATTCLRAPG